MNKEIFNDKLIIGKIIEVKDHPNADRLHVLQVDVGSEVYEIVCGGLNVKVGMIVPMILIGGKVLDKSGQLYEIAEREIRGIVSKGMLCSGSELGIEDPSGNILYLPKDLEMFLGKPLISVWEEELEKKEKSYRESKALNKTKEIQKKEYTPKTSIENEIYKILSLIIKDKFGEGFVKELEIEHPADEKFGDFSTNIAMKLSKALKKNPREIAEEIIGDWRNYLYSDKKPVIEDVSIAGPGFINIFINKELLTEELITIWTNQEKYGKTGIHSGERILLEHTSANPNKAMHIGHIRNNLLGNSLTNLLEAVGYEVVVDYIANDRGASISKVMWGYLNLAKKDNNLIFADIEDIKTKLTEMNFEELLQKWNENPKLWLTPNDFSEIKSDALMEKIYVSASELSKSFDWVQNQVSEILVQWENENELNRKLWKQILDWVFTGQKETMKRLGSRTDHYWFESDHYKGGKEIVEKGIEKGVFRKDGSAVVTNFEKYGIPDTIVIKSDGTALYITQDLKLTELKTKNFPSDKYIWVVGSEQSLTLKQAFLADYLLGIVNDLDKLYHFAYGLFTTSVGEKISSRKGNVISADELLDLVFNKAKEVVEEKSSEYSDEYKNEVAEKVGMGALKYFILKANPLSAIKFDLDEATSFDGNTGPYLMYSYARAKSILHDNTNVISDFVSNLDSRLRENDTNKMFETEYETAVLRTLYKFPEAVFNAAENYAPNYIADYIFDLAQKFNAFYRECPVLNVTDENVKNSRLLLTSSVAQVLKNGLKLLGIDTLEKM